MGASIMLNCLIPPRFKSAAHVAQCPDCQSQFRQSELAQSLLAERAERVEQNWQQWHTPSPAFMQRLAHRLRIEREPYPSSWDTAVLDWRSWPQLLAACGAMALLLVALAATLSLKPAAQEEEVFTANSIESVSHNGFWMEE
jgi:hypothetical protein